MTGHHAGTHGTCYLRTQSLGEPTPYTDDQRTCYVPEASSEESEGNDNQAFWRNKYDNQYCNNQHGPLSQDAGAGTLKDAARCGALAALDDKCNPNIVMVGDNRCLCAKADDLCTSRGSNNLYAVFVKDHISMVDYKRFGSSKTAD